jgi:hypothetical protein
MLHEEETTISTRKLARGCRFGTRDSTSLFGNQLKSTSTSIYSYSQSGKLCSIVYVHGKKPYSSGDKRPNPLSNPDLYPYDTSTIEYRQEQCIEWRKNHPNEREKHHAVAYYEKSYAVKSF